MEKAVRDMVEIGYGRVNFPFSQFMPGVFAGLLRLIAEPADYRAEWEFDFSGMPKPDPDDGLVERNREKNPNTAEPYDDKLFFHYRPSLPGHLSGRVKAGKLDIERYQDWLRECGSLWVACRTAVAEITEEMDRQIPGNNFRAGVEKSDDKHVLRLLWYRAPVKVATGEEVIAQRHTDRDFLTLHVAENYAGLFVHGRVIPAEHDLAIAFPGQKAQLMTRGRFIGPPGREPLIEGGKIVALPHAVIDTVGRSDHRVSAVFFAHTPFVIPTEEQPVAATAP